MDNLWSKIRDYCRTACFSISLTFLPTRHNWVAFSKHAVETPGTVGILAAILAFLPESKAQSKVVVAEEPWMAIDLRAAHLHLQ